MRPFSDVGLSGNGHERIIGDRVGFLRTRPPLQSLVVADRTVAFHAGNGRSYDITGSDSDSGVLLSIANHDGRYAEEVSAFLASRVPTAGVVLDVGANIGVLTVMLSDLAAGGSVVAFEPSAENLRYLRANVAGRKNVEIVEAAVASHDGHLQFDDNPEYPAGAHLAPGGSVSTPCRSIDSWAGEHGLTRLDVMKIDVEGAEPQVLSGAGETIRRFRPTIVAECNVASLRRVCGSGFSELHEQLCSLVPHVGILRPGGKVVPLASDEHLELALGAEGVVDLVGYWNRPSMSACIRARWQLRGLRRSLSRSTPPSPHNFVVTAPITIDIDPQAPLKARLGKDLMVRVRVTNASRWWLSSGFVYHPVNVAARWVGGAESGRAAFPAPVPAGGTAEVSLSVTPPPKPGEHLLEITLVQEHFAWMSDIDPGCGVKVPVVVTSGQGGV